MKEARVRRPASIALRAGRAPAQCSQLHTRHGCGQVRTQQQPLGTPCSPPTQSTRVVRALAARRGPRTPSWLVTAFSAFCPGGFALEDPHWRRVTRLCRQAEASAWQPRRRLPRLSPQLAHRRPQQRRRLQHRAFKGPAPGAWRSARQHSDGGSRHAGHCNCMHGMGAGETAHVSGGG